MRQVTLAGNGINWTWYMVATISGETITVKQYYRLHDRRDANHPKTNGTLEKLIEMDDRTLIAVKTGGKIYKLSNPANVFSFN